MEVPPYDPQGSGARWALRERLRDLVAWFRNRAGHRLRDVWGLVVHDGIGKAARVAGAYLRHLTRRRP